ncbi:MAG TPA: LPXTG cell wall anchor domain-containing protein [Gemmatimonadales bacterium]|nr:LPXTG cell wall anchor domain-containing protein [Gemmatimonadales bacterium]
MRYLKTILSSLSLLLVSSATAVAMMVQDPPIRVNVETSEGSTTWYTSPQWLAIIGLAVLLIIVAIVAARKRRSTTTVIR